MKTSRLVLILVCLVVNPAFFEAQSLRITKESQEQSLNDDKSSMECPGTKHVSICFHYAEADFECHFNSDCGPGMLCCEDSCMKLCVKGIKVSSQENKTAGTTENVSFTVVKYNSQMPSFSDINKSKNIEKFKPKLKHLFKQKKTDNIKILKEKLEESNEDKLEKSAESKEATKNMDAGTEHSDILREETKTQFQTVKQGTSSNIPKDINSRLTPTPKSRDDAKIIDTEERLEDMEQIASEMELNEANLSGMKQPKRISADLKFLGVDSHPIRTVNILTNHLPDTITTQKIAETTRVFNNKQAIFQIFLSNIMNDTGKLQTANNTEHFTSTQERPENVTDNTMTTEISRSTTKNNVEKNQDRHLSDALVTILKDLTTDLEDGHNVTEKSNEHRSIEHGEPKISKDKTKNIIMITAASQKHDIKSHLFTNFSRFPKIVTTAQDRKTTDNNIQSVKIEYENETTRTKSMFPQEDWYKYFRNFERDDLSEDFRQEMEEDLQRQDEGQKDSDNGSS